MFRLWILGFLLVFQHFASYGISFDDFIQSEKNKTKETIKAEAWSLFKDKHVVFVHGMMNELAVIPNNYFNDNMAALKELGISYSNRRYSTGKTIQENSAKLYKDLGEIYKKRQKKLILIGHSKGAATSLNTILENPHLLREGVVDRVVLVNGAIGGSHLVPNIRTHPDAWLVGKCMGRGLKTLDPSEAQHTFAAAFSKFRNAVDDNEFANFSSRVFYLRTAVKTPVSSGVSWVQFFSDKSVLEGMKHDGILTLEQQMLDAKFGFGVDIENDLDADHVELVLSGIMSRSDRKTRKALTRALLQRIYESYGLVNI